MSKSSQSSASNLLKIPLNKVHEVTSEGESPARLSSQKYEEQGELMLGSKTPKKKSVSQNQLNTSGSLEINNRPVSYEI